jgi:hypothetical protein
MSKSFYIFLNVFLGLTVAAGLLQGILRVLIGAQIFTLDSFVAWFLVANVVALAGLVFLLKYYHYRRYWFAFSTGTIAAIASLFYLVVFYVMLVSRELGNYYLPMLFFYLGANILYAISLVFSVTRKTRWIKTAGLFSFIIYLVVMLAVIWNLHSPTVQVTNTVEKIAEWASIAGSLVPVLFMMHFIGELRLLKQENTNLPMRKNLENILGLAGILAFIFTIAIGAMMVSESYSTLYWQGRNAARTQELAKLSESRSFVGSKGDSLHYLLLKPLDYNSQKKYPLVVCLPYGGYEAPAAQFLSTGDNRREYPAFLFVPYCPPGSGWGGIPNYPTVDSLVYDAITSLNNEPGVDVKRRYITGLSRGAYGTWHFICARPDLFAAAVPVAGGGDPKLAPKLVNVPVWAFHGKKDRNVPVSGSRDMIAAIKKAGGNPRYTEFPDEGHNIWYQVSITPGLWDWLFAQERK